jgi:hypothetical protein
MYTKENYKKDILELLQRDGYRPVAVAKATYEIFINNQKNIDDVTGRNNAIISTSPATNRM